MRCLVSGRINSNSSDNLTALGWFVSCLAVLCGLLGAAGAQAGNVAGLFECNPQMIDAKNDEVWRGLAADNDRLYLHRPCSDDRCLAAQDLACVFDAQFRRDVPNSLARLAGSYEKDVIVYNATINGLGRKHPDRIAMYCRLLAEIAALDEDRPHDGAVTMSITELAARLSRLGRPHCIDDVMAALPRTSEMAEVIKNAREACEGIVPGCK